MNGMKDGGIDIVTEETPCQCNGRTPGEEVFTAMLALSTESTGVRGGVIVHEGGDVRGRGI